MSTFIHTLLVAVAFTAFLKTSSGKDKITAFLKKISGKDKICTYNGIEYGDKAMVDKGDPCLECYCRKGTISCSKTICVDQEGCASLVDDGACCPRCECRDSAGNLHQKENKWQNVVDNTCYDCKCGKDMTARCKKTKQKCEPCKAGQTEVFFKNRSCPACRERLVPSGHVDPPMKFKSWKEVDEYVKLKKGGKSKISG
ncbi:predicted protein [Nematostella vectensis]|uniref:VWFC domain-containing protein n=1 Tax=Nematostella vectensis TaxID=45351 RepID=A7ST33_NEMVE|nr:predicted protein [Nematostella vectensis]|eukprot:XP_001625231.1 predicted protein [Nematostella vectensis]